MSDSLTKVNAKDVFICVKETLEFSLNSQVIKSLSFTSFYNSTKLNRKWYLKVMKIFVWYNSYEDSCTLKVAFKNIKVNKFSSTNNKTFVMIFRSEK